MVQAYILIQTEVGRAAAVASDVAGIDGVTRAEDVTGPYDVIVHVDRNDDADLSDAVTAVRKVPGITRTLTCPVVGSPA
ncbi:Lrp/AsnC ligand binding domain-containing protein [Actinomycetospora termitidis]|uniref:Lrp/AsnC ligand binding domain-containing protein n=1 Tax=Actinomycetospora termitidis TaxID=3053470 RepID=A0ABT7M7Z8_9PSEU|nr:Lrp/AsnC ligand binding domain-containing protein [Actinomycetospora sp. Odt1-22]MDL5155927.1 Lrp/AsnC ligand binding domain-containing protein [Actinomycetospora sp. Odt1-22]